MSRPIKERLVAAGKAEAEATAVATAFVADYAAKADKKRLEKSSVLVYFSWEEVQMVVKACWPIGTRPWLLPKRIGPFLTW